MGLIRNGAKTGAKQAVALKGLVEQGEAGAIGPTAANRPQAVLSWGRGSEERDVPGVGRMAAYTVFVLTADFLYYQQLADPPKMNLKARATVPTIPGAHLPQRRELERGIVMAVAISTGGLANAAPGGNNTKGSDSGRWDIAFAPPDARSTYDEIFYSFFRSFGGLSPREAASFVVRSVAGSW